MPFAGTAHDSTAADSIAAASLLISFVMPSLLYS